MEKTKWILLVTDGNKVWNKFLEADSSEPETLKDRLKI